MSITELKAEMSKITSEERRELAAYLAQMEELFPGDLMAKLSAKIDDKDPSHWVSLDDIDKHLSK